MGMVQNQKQEQGHIYNFG